MKGVVGLRINERSVMYVRIQLLDFGILGRVGLGYGSLNKVTGWLHDNQYIEFESLMGGRLL